jgi:hypothetical protein
MSDHLKLVASDPPPEIEQTVLRIYKDARSLRLHLRRAQVRTSASLLRRARDDLSILLGDTAIQIEE